MSIATVSSTRRPSFQPASDDVSLETGDHLSQAEFHRRYELLPHVKKAELIEGIVYMPSPLRLRKHGRPHVQISTWLGYYISKTPGITDYGDNATVILDNDNEYQPDLLMALPRHAGGGQSRVNNADYVEGGVEFVAEVAASSVSIDRHEKFEVYQKHGVREYLLWRVADGAIDWFKLRNGKFEQASMDEAGIIKSDVFPGLWLDPAALMRGDLPRLFEIVDVGTRSPEHASFVERLRADAD
jgi:Uma2 family endonuclease